MPARDWLVDRAVQLAAVWKPALLTRDTLKMCWDAQPVRGIPLPPNYSFDVLTSPEAPAEWLATMAAAGMPSSPRTWRHEFAERPHSRVIAVTHASHMVGAAGIRPIRSMEFATHLMWVAVHPDHRGRQLGRALVTEAMRWAAEEQFRHIFLMTDDHRIDAIRLYLRLGFRPCLGSWDRTQHYRWLRMGISDDAANPFCRRPEHRAIVANLKD